MAGTLTIFDVDDTLFRTKAITRVLVNGMPLYSLTDSELNSHTLKHHEEYDYSQYYDANFFRVTADPIERMVEKARLIVKAKDNPDSRAIIVTARPWLDDMPLFIQTFHDHGIDIDEVDFHCVGDDYTCNTAEAKKKIFRLYLSRGNYNATRIYEDNILNIEGFLELKQEYPDVSFEAFRVLEDGIIMEVVS